MAFFHIWCVSPSKQSEHFVLLGKDIAHIESDLTHFGFKVLSHKRSYSLLGARFYHLDRVYFFHTLSHLLKAGLSLIDALSAIQTDTHDLKIKSICQTMILYIQHGSDLVVPALKDFLTPLACHSLNQAQALGDLPNTLQTLGDYYLEQDEISKEWRKILQYPLLVFALLCTLIGILSSTLMPNLMNMMPDQQQNFAQKSFLWVTEHVDLITLFFLSLIGAGILLWRRPDKIKALSRLHYVNFWKSLAFCIHNQLPLLEALKIAQTHLPWQLHNQIDHVILKITDGLPIDHAFKSVPHLSFTVQSLLKIPAATGDLKKVVDDIVTIENSFKKKITKFIIYWTQPLLVFMMGLIVLWILFATIIPLYDRFSDV